MIVHSVYIKLGKKDDAILAKALDDAKSFANKIPNIEYYQAGTACPCVRPIQDKDFDLALVCVFPQAADLENYLVHPDHLAFCARNEGNWASVRIFDFES